MSEPTSLSNYLAEHHVKCACGYDLHGTAGTDCPECGTQIVLNAHDPRVATRSWRLAFIVCLYGVFIGVYEVHDWIWKAITDLPYAIKWAQDSTITLVHLLFMLGTATAGFVGLILLVLRRRRITPLVLRYVNICTLVYCLCTAATSVAMLVVIARAYKS